MASMCAIIPLYIVFFYVEISDQPTYKGKPTPGKGKPDSSSTDEFEGLTCFGLNLRSLWFT